MRPNRYFIRFAIIMALFFYGSFIDSDFVMMAGSSLLIFWVGHPMIKRWAKPSNQLPYSGFFIALCALSPLGTTSDFFFTLMGFTTVLWMGYAVTSHLPNKSQARLTGSQAKKLGLVKDLKARVKDLSQALEQLTADKGQLAWDSYKTQAKQLLNHLEALKQDLITHQKSLEPATFHRLLARIQVEKTTLAQSLQQEQGAATSHVSTEQVAQEAPELLEAVTAISQDSQTIMDRLLTSDSSNKAELRQLHETNMTRFKAILDGYLAIKRSPNHYYDAKGRLATAQTTIEGFALALKDQLKQLNENDMHEFEVNLRLLNTKT